ncbi:hypothetical protein Tco_1269285, partial [Tanacetum coccineum]
MYPMTTSESLAGDSSSESFAGPSRKRCRSPAATVTSSIYSTRALVPSHVLEDIEAEATAVKVAVDRDVKARIDVGISMKVDVRVDVEDEVEDKVESSDRGTMKVGVDVVARIDILDVMLMPDALECLEQVEEGLQDIYDHVIEIPLQRIEDIEMRQIELKSRSLIASRDGNGGARNGGNGNGGNGNPNENNKDARPVARECTYQDFMKCQPLNFKGTEGV